MLAAIASLAEYPSQIRDIFYNNVSNSNGAYGVRIFYGGVPNLVVVDDYMPWTGYSLAFTHIN